MTDPSGLRVIEALAPSVSRYWVECPPMKMTTEALLEPMNEWFSVKTYDSLPTFWNPHLFWEAYRQMRFDCDHQLAP